MRPYVYGYYSPDMMRFALLIIGIMIVSATIGIILAEYWRHR